MKKIYPILFLLLFTFSAKATHISYMDITYKNLGGNTYEFTYTLYRDCAGVGAPGLMILEYCSPSGCFAGTGSITLMLVAGTGLPVFPVCSNPLSTCVGGTDEGFQKYVYKATATLPTACSDWTFYLNYCCREFIITGIVAAGSTGTGLTFKIDNLNFPGNSSPTFNDEPVLFACCNQSFSYNQSATDIDGDSLVYSLYHPFTDNLTCTTGSTVTYSGAYTYLQPITSLPLMSMNSLTGYLTMYPTNCTEVSVMGVKVEEYRSGVFIGSILRDNMIIVTNQTALGIKESTEESISVYPNPTNSVATLHGIERGNQIEVFSVLGEKMFSMPIEGNQKEVELDLSDLSKGMYLIKVLTESGMITKKIIKE